MFCELVKDEDQFKRKVITETHMRKYKKLLYKRDKLLFGEPCTADFLKGNPTGNYCYCRGKQEFPSYVECKGGEDNCKYGGWIHPQCSDELKDLSAEHLDTMGDWYCKDCHHKRQRKRLKKKMQRLNRRVIVDSTHVTLDLSSQFENTYEYQECSQDESDNEPGSIIG